MRKAMVHFLAGAALVAAMAASAKDTKDAVNADSRDKFEAVATGVKAQMEPGGRYKVTDAEKKAVNQKFDDMSKLFAEHATVAEMGKDTQTQLFNDQEAINAILAKRDDQRLICKKVAPIGSHIPVTTCHTYAEEQEMHNAASKQMDQWSRTQGAGSGR